METTGGNEEARGGEGEWDENKGGREEDGERGKEREGERKGGGRGHEGERNERKEKLGQRRTKIIKDYL